jgi:hypothetical protein
MITISRLNSQQISDGESLESLDDALRAAETAALETVRKSKSAKARRVPLSACPPVPPTCRRS